MTPAAQLEQPHPMIPQSETILPNTRLRETSRFAFFAGDHVTTAEKYAMPSRAMGGVELDMFLTLKETGKELYARKDLFNTGGFMYRCAITQLKTFYLPVNAQMVAPTDRDPDAGKFVHGYVKQNGRFNAVTGIFEDVTVNGGGTIIYRPFYPGDEIESLTRPSQGLRPGGIVEIGALYGKSAKEQIAAQLHFFPNWEQLQTGEASFPKTLKELRDGIAARMIGTTGDMNSIGRDMLRSCDEFRLWGLRYIKAWRQVVKWSDSQIESPIAGYNDLCETLFELLQVNREDTLGQAGNVTDIATQIGQSIASAISQGLSPQQAAQKVSDETIGDPLAGLAAVDEPLGEILPTVEPVSPAAAGNAVENPQDQTVVAGAGEGESDPPVGNQTAAGARMDDDIKVSQKVIVMADDREGLVTWKGPNNKIKLAFEDGSSAMFDKSEVTPKPV